MVFVPSFLIDIISTFRIIKSCLSVFPSLVYHSLLSHSLPSEAYLHWVQFLSIKNNTL